MIDPEQIRRRLVEVWAALGDEVMRACSLTLVTVVDSAERAGVIQTLAELMPEHPSRAILIDIDSAAGRLEADVEAQCWMPFGQRRQICSEQIVIRCSEDTLGETANVVLPLVAPDLPVVIWCASRLAWRSAAFEALAAPAHRILADSLRIPEAFGVAGVADLSWTRLTRWRALLAQVFENPLHRRLIPALSSLTVCYERPRPPAALLMAGWVASRLEWDEDRLLSRVRFESLPGDSHGRLAGLELAAEAEGARVAVRRTGEACGEVRVELAGRTPVLARVSLPPSSDLLLLSEELSLHAPDPVFEESRERARRLAVSHPPETWLPMPEPGI